jgi:tetratricopeptide (TPR) repeat protein
MPGGGAVERLTAAARRAMLAPAAVDIADALWLASRITSVPSAPESRNDSATDGPPAVSDDVPASAGGARDRTDGGSGPEIALDEIAVRDDSRSAQTITRRDEVEVRRRVAGQAQPHGVPFRAPTAPALARLGLARALRPFKRHVPVTGDGDLDAEATAHEAALTDVLLPVFGPREVRWLDVAVVVDTSASMAVSAQTIRELVATLGELGAFRDVRVWRCHSDGADERIRLTAERAATGITHDPAELIDPRGRRVVLVVSDLLGRAWQDGRMGGALETWGKAGPLAIVQPLPQRLWDDCGPPIRSVALSCVAPATANGDLSVVLEDLAPAFPGSAKEPPPPGIVVPLIELGARWLASWATLVTGDTDQAYHGRAIFTGQLETPGFLAGSASPAPEDPRVAVARFIETASTDAARLAPFLAAAAPLTLPVMRLVQRAKLPAAAPTALREVFLGGLLEQVTDTAADPEETVYDFVQGTRKELIGNLTRQDALSVLVEVSRYLVSRLGTNLDFLALLAAQYPVTDLDERGRAFAAVAVDVLEAIGGSYRQTAARLRNLLNHDIPGQNAASDNQTETVSGVANYTTPAIYIPAREAGYAPGGWKTVPPKNQNFVGRDSMLNQMRSMLVNSSQTAVLLPRALYGLGGVGKTQLAIEYAHRHRSDYDLVWWIAAEDPAEIRRSLVELAEQLELPVTGDTGGTIRRVHEALARRDKFQHWLLVFDNVGEPASVASLLPSSRDGHVLITTRESSWEELGQAVQVDKFERRESVALLGRHGGLAGADADAVADRLGDLPISLAQAAAWHEETKKPVAEYLRLFNAELERRRDDTEALGYPLQATAAMSIAFDQLRQGSAHAAQLLQLASYFGPEWISLDLLHRGRLATPLSRRLSKTLRDQAPLERAVKDIARWELARNDTRNLRFQVHRLVQRMVQAEMEPELRGEVRDTVQTMLAYANPGNPDLIPPQERQKHAELSAHIVASGLIESDDDEARQVVLDQIRYRYNVGDYESSRDLATEALAIWEPRFGAEDELTLIARRHRSNAIAALGGAAEALETDRDILAGFVASVGRDHEHTMATVGSVTRNLRTLGRFTEARRLDEENYQRHLRVLGTEDRATVKTASNFAVDLRMLGEYAAALELDEHTLATAQRVFGRADSDTLRVDRNVASDLYALGRYGEALRRQRGSIAEYETVQGANHQDVLLARRTIAICLRKIGRMREAVDESRSLVLAFRNRFGDEHWLTLLTRQSLMNALRENGDVVEAIRVGEAAMERYRIDFPAHPFTHVCATNLAITYRQAGRGNAARQLNEEALANLTEAFGPDNPYTLCCATNLANDVAAVGDVDTAREMSGDILDRSRVVRGPRQPYTLACAVNHAIDLIATGDPSGTALLTEAVDTMSRMPDFGEGHPDVTLARDGKRIDCDIEAPPT